MKYAIFISVITLLTSCGNSQKLLEKNTIDNGKAIVKKGFFSGIDYIYVEKKLNGKIQYKLIYDCECGINNKVSLRKDYLFNKQTSVWTAVTNKDDLKFFDDVIDESRIYKPIEFMPITEEELSLLKEGLDKVNKPCCKKENKPISKIIGYIRVKLN